MKSAVVEFHEGNPDSDKLSQWCPREGLLVMDDLMEEGGNDKRVLDLFTKPSQYLNMIVLYLFQDMFSPGKYAISISRYTHYIVAFKKPRDQLAMRNLLLEGFPSRWQDVMVTFQCLMERPYGCMTIDFHP